MITVSPYTKAITDATANPEDVVSGKVFYNNSGRHTGTVDQSCIEHRVEQMVSYSDVILTSLRDVDAVELCYMACGENTTTDTSNVVERNNHIPIINGKVIPTYVKTTTNPGSEWAGTRIDINKDISKIGSVFMDAYEFVIPLNVMKRYSDMDDNPYLCMTQFAYINEVCVFSDLWDELRLVSHNTYLSDCNILLRHNGSILTSMSLVIPSGSNYYQSKNVSFTYGYTYVD